MTEGWFTSWDGTELFKRTWEPQGGGDKALIVIHRGHEHSGRVQQQIEALRRQVEDLSGSGADLSANR